MRASGWSTGTAVDRALIEREGPDAVIVATGGKPTGPPGMEVADEAHVVDAWQVLRGKANVGQSVVVADWRCDWVGMGLAEMLARDGCRVRLAVNGLHAGETFASFTCATWRSAACTSSGSRSSPMPAFSARDAETVYLQHTTSGEPMIIEEVDTLVLAQGQVPDMGLLDSLEGYDGEVVAIGDCLAARTAEEAVLDGLKAAWSL